VDFSFIKEVNSKTSFTQMLSGKDLSSCDMSFLNSFSTYGKSRKSKIFGLEKSPAYVSPKKYERSRIDTSSHHYLINTTKKKAQKKDTLLEGSPTKSKIELT
jgi:hypothetical protein